MSAKGASVSTNFTLNGHFNKEGQMLGTFTGCEIARDAGSVSGIFKAVRSGEGAGAGEEPDKEAEDDE